MDATARPSPLRWGVLLSAVFGYVALQMTQLSYAPVLPLVAKDLGIDVGAATNLMAAFLLSACLSLILVGGYVCDRFGVLASLTLGLLFTAAPASLTPWLGTTYGRVLWLRVLGGAGAGFLFPAMGAIVALWFPPKEKGLASGLMGASISVGSAVGVLAGPAVTAAVGSWREMSALLSLVAWAGVAFVVGFSVVKRPRAPGAAAGPEAGGGDFKAALARPVTWVGIAVIFMAAWGMQCLYGLTPTFLAADRPVGAGYGPLLSGQLMAAVMVAGVIGPVLGGLLMDKVFRGSPEPVMTIGFALMTVCVYLLSLLPVYSNVSVLAAALFTAGLGIQFVYPAIFVFVARVYPGPIVGKMTGLWSGLGTFGGVAGMVLGGLAVKRFGDYSVALALISAASLVGFLTVFVLRRVGVRQAVP